MQSEPPPVGCFPAAGAVSAPGRGTGNGHREIPELPTHFPFSQMPGGEGKVSKALHTESLERLGDPLGKGLIPSPPGSLRGSAVIGVA